jgi:hypothetical protein
MMEETPTGVIVIFAVVLLVIAALLSTLVIRVLRRWSDGVANEPEHLELDDDVAPQRPAAPPPAAVEPTPPADIPDTARATVDTSAVALDLEPYGHGSAYPLPNGAAPTPEYTVKGDVDAYVFHSPDSPQFSSTRAEVWFKTEHDARKAGFLRWDQSGEES